MNKSVGFRCALPKLQGLKEEQWRAGERNWHPLQICLDHAIHFQLKIEREYVSCPICGLINPNSALRCNCGYDFSTGTMKESYVTLKAAKVGIDAVIEAKSELITEQIKSPEDRLAPT